MGDLIISAGEDNQVLIWDLKYRQCIARMKCIGSPNSIMTMGNKHLLLSTKQGRIFKYRFHDSQSPFKETELKRIETRTIERHDQEIASDIKPSSLIAIDDGLICIEDNKVIKMSKIMNE